MSLPINHIALARLTEDGQFDAGFGEAGRILAAFQPDADSSAAALILDNQDRSIVLGTGRGPQGSRMVLARFTAAGRLDSTFGGGMVSLDFPNIDRTTAAAAALDSDGNIIAAGTATQGNTRRFAIVRLLPDGGLDPQFGDQGLVLVDFDAPGNAIGQIAAAQASAIAIDNEGRIVIGGTVAFHAGDSAPPFEVYGQFALARLQRDGTLDLSFNGIGKALTDFSVNPNLSPEAAGRALAIDSVGRIILCGDDQFGRRGAVAVHLPDGQLDPRFGSASPIGAGRITFGFRRPATGARSAFAQTLALGLDGQDRIIVGGWARFGTIAQSLTVSALARFLADGVKDSTFGQDSETLTDFPPHLIGTESINAVRIDQAGRILTAGFSRGGREMHQIALGRYLESGQLDSSLNGTGQILADFDEINSFFGEAVSLELDSQGRIVIAGHAYLP